MFAAMATAVMALGVVHFIFQHSEARLGTLDAATGQQVNATYDRMIAAAESLNLEGLFRDVLDNNHGALVVDGRLFLTRDAALDQVRRNFRNVTAVKYHVAERHLTLLTPTTALLVTTGTSSARLADGREVGGGFAHTVVFARDAGEWRVRHSHQSAPR